jgi:hypothetical protein
MMAEVANQYRARRPSIRRARSDRIARNPRSSRRILDSVMSQTYHSFDRMNTCVRCRFESKT